MKCSQGKSEGFIVVDGVTIKELGVVAGAVSGVVGSVFIAGATWRQLNLRLKQLEKDVGTHALKFDKIETKFKEARNDQDSKFETIKEMMLAHETEMRELAEGKVRSETMLEFIKGAVERITEKIDKLESK